MIHFNRLTPGQLERLAVLVEECGEAIQAVGKIMRRGWTTDNYNNNKNPLYQVTILIIFKDLL